jgi:hypothetical protein
MRSSHAGIVDATSFRESLTQAAQSSGFPMGPILRTLLVEAWLSHLETWNDSTTSCPRSISVRRLFGDSTYQQGFFS